MMTAIIINKQVVLIFFRFSSVYVLRLFNNDFSFFFLLFASIVKLEITDGLSSLVQHVQAILKGNLLAGVRFALGA